MAVVRSYDRAHNGLLFAEQAGSPKRKSAPMFVITQEQYSRIVRLLEAKQAVKLRAAIAAQFSPSQVDGMNLIGDDWRTL